MWLILAESDIPPDLADGLGSDVKERGYVLQGKVLHDAGTTLQQQLIPPTASMRSFKWYLPRRMKAHMFVSSKYRWCFMTHWRICPRTPAYDFSNGVPRWGGSPARRRPCTHRRSRCRSSRQCSVSVSRPRAWLASRSQPASLSAGVSDCRPSPSASPSSGWWVVWSSVFLLLHPYSQCFYVSTPQSYAIILEYRALFTVFFSVQT